MKGVITKLSLAVALTCMSVPFALWAASAGTDLYSSQSNLAKKVRHKLVELPYLTVFDNLEYRVDGDTVTLAGEVTQPFLKADAERAVKHIEGVAKVNNEIKVLPLSPFDNQIRRAEYRAIFGYAGLYRYAMGTQPSIRIIVDNGHVTLEGVVDSPMDKQIAGMRANGVPGVFSVTNDLQVAGKSKS